MNKKDRFKLVGLADEKFIEEANPKNKKINKKRITAAILAACFTLLFISANLYLFLPIQPYAPEIAQYRDDEYYPVIEKLSTIFYKEPTYKNNFDRLFSSLDVKGDMAPGDADFGASDDETAAPPVDSAKPDGGNYEEVTDNQTAGVIEADKIKRTSTHIFYLDGRTLKAYSINKENSELVGSYKVNLTAIGSGYTTAAAAEFYLSNDGKTATLFFPAYDKDIGAFVAVLSLDVSNPAAITCKKTLKIEGSYTSSRKTDDGITLVSSYYLETSSVDFGEPETFVPNIDTGEGFEPLSPENVYIPEKITNRRYVVISRISEDGLEFDKSDSVAFLSHETEFYMGTENIYLYNNRVDSSSTHRENVSDITVVSHGDGGFELKGTFTVKGHVLNRFSLDEYNGILRAVTTTSYYGYNTTGDEGKEDATQNGENASLYCIDLETFEVVASVENFAPWGESVRSARFDGDTAYVCTAIVVTDPVFFFDLSDLSNITYKETGEIKGFSTSLINLGEGFLLGIGQNENGSLKIEVYEEGTDGILSVDSIVYENAYYSTEYKSYYINRDENIIGLGISGYSTYEYIVLHFDGYNINELAREKLSAGHIQHMRGVLIDGWYYMFGINDFKVVSLFGN